MWYTAADPRAPRRPHHGGQRTARPAIRSGRRDLSPPPWQPRFAPKTFRRSTRLFRLPTRLFGLTPLLRAVHQCLTTEGAETPVRAARKEACERIRFAQSGHTSPTFNGRQMICGRDIDEWHEVPLFVIIHPCPAKRVSAPSVVNGAGCSRQLIIRDSRLPPAADPFVLSSRSS